MGEVYRGYDENLERPVAIKQIRSSELAEPSLVKRFLREARSTAELRHPAIVQIHHMIKENDSDYIVMEFVEGRPLSQVLREDGPLPAPRAAALFREIAAGLAAAHSRGIVHRDIKASNLMVTPDGHARILDFGLAKRLHSKEVSLSASGRILGTPHTMSPEQASGEQVDHRSDLFSFGAVLYETLSGQAPFRAESLTATLLKVCTHNPPPLVDLDPKIPQPLSDLVVGLLQKNPADRPQYATEVAVELASDESDISTVPAAAARPPSFVTQPTVDEPSPLPTPLPRRRSLLSLWPLVLILSIVVLVAIWQLGPWSEEVSPPTRPAIAILGLDNLTHRSEHDWLATAISVVLETELSVGEQIRVVGSGEVARAKRELVLRSLTELTQEDFQQLSRNLGVDTLVWGTYSKFGDRDEVRIDLRMQDAETGVVASAGSNGPVHDLIGIVSTAADKLRLQLGKRTLTSTQVSEVESALPTRSEALRLYSEGLGHLRELNFLAAKDRLSEAVEIEAHPMPYAALAEVWFALGFEPKAREAADQARTLSHNLPTKAEQRIRARYHATVGEWTKAVSIYGSLFRSAQDDIDLGLQLAEAQIEAKWLEEAGKTLERLRQLPEPLASDPRIDLTQARVAYWEGEWDAMRRFAERAATRGEAQGAPLLVAEARLRQTTALQELDRSREAMASLQEAKQLFDTYGHRQGSAKALELMAYAIWDAGDLAGSRKLFRTALETYREIGNQNRVGIVQGALGSNLLDEGRLDEAVAMLQGALDLLRSTGDQRSAAFVLDYFGVGFFKRGDWSRALEHYTQGLAIWQAIQDKAGIATATTNIAEVHYMQGDLDLAQNMHEQALDLKREIPDPEGMAYDTHRLGMILAARGELFAAKQKLEAALRNRADTPKDATETRLELARVGLAEGDPVAAESLARQSEQVSRSEEWDDLATLSQAILAQALLAQGLVDDARSVFAELPDLDAIEDQQVRLTVAIALQRVAATTDAPSAEESLERIVIEAGELGYMELGFEARLANAEVLKTLEPRQATARLQVLRREAERLGYGQIADRATRAFQERVEDLRPQQLVSQLAV